MLPITPDELKTCPVFRGLSEPDFRQLVVCMSRRYLAHSGMILFENEVDSDAAYVIQSGVLVAEMPVDGGVAVEMAKMGPGAVVGELCLIKGGPRSLRVKAVSETHLIRIDREKFADLRSAKNAAAYTVIRNICLTMCDRLRKSNEFIERELRHETPMAADFTSVSEDTLADRARSYLSKLFGRGS
ncbi:MAG: cyclic nucleotide-binding domain-containing protein [Myxococcota bacterium]|nr:cyclic nucleotide-binding domain-containing protein [Myxococcota bacterium]